MRVSERFVHRLFLLFGLFFIVDGFRRWLDGYWGLRHLGYVSELPVNVVRLVFDVAGGVYVMVVGVAMILVGAVYVYVELRLRSLCRAGEGD